MPSNVALCQVVNNLKRPVYSGLLVLQCIPNTKEKHWNNLILGGNYL